MEPPVRRHVVGIRSANRTLNLVGSPNETNVIVGGNYSTALIDTGSCVSTVCESYYKQCLSFCQIQPVDRILKIECADGKHLPYLGFIETTIALAAPGDINLQCLLLVVPDSEYSSNVPVHLQESYKKAMERCDKAQTKQKDQFDKKARAMKLDIGDKVLVKNLAIEGKKKLSNFYEEGTSTVVQQLKQNIPVYIVRSEDGKERTLHRNHLIPVETHKRPTPTPRKRKTQGKNLQTVVKDQESGDEDKGEETEEEEILNITYNPATMEPRTNTQEAERNNSDSEDASQETPNATELQAIIEPPRIIPRRSTRQRRKPQWHQTYSMSMIDKTDAIRKLSESGFFMDSPRHITDMVIKAVL